jgi:DNA (cytosine-5)-methyltransferase 1
MPKEAKWTVVDLFSGGGGMSYGFHRHRDFEIVGAADAQVAKPSSGRGTLECNSTYFANIGVQPLEEDLSAVEPAALKAKMSNLQPNVLIACAPCTGFSRTNASNHLRDDPRNSLVARTADFVAVYRPDIVVMENARELLRGNFTHHFHVLRDRLIAQGYQVTAEIHFLDKFGLPQRRERALVIAARQPFAVHTLEELWQGWKVRREATTVKRAIGGLPKLKAGTADPADQWHACPSLGEMGLRRLRAIPRNGGSWIDIKDRPDADELLTPAMKRYIEKGDFGSHPDVYGRLWWDRPAVTVKRECGHTGNGRYAHPEQDRLCSVREMACLQGFPETYQFACTSLGNMYRHIGDAVPPLISYQIAHVCEWILSGTKPSVQSAILHGTQLTAADILCDAHQFSLPLAC